MPDYLLVFLSTLHQKVYNTPDDLLIDDPILHLWKFEDYADQAREVTLRLEWDLFAELQTVKSYVYDLIV